TGLANNQSGRIGDLTGKTLTGSVKWERYVAGNTTWRQIGTPISGQALSNWYDPTNFPMSGHFPGSDYAGGFTSAYYYDEAKASLYSDFDSGYVEPTNITNSISPDAINGKGWAIYLGQTADMAAMNPFTVKMTGNPITGNQPYILTNGGNIGEGYATSETGYHLLANPYPSQIDISASGWSNIDGYYSLDPNTGNYDFYDLNSFTGSGTATGIVAQGQAILLYTATNNNTITFTENMKTSAGGSESFLRQAATPTFAYNSLDIKISSNETTFSDRTKIMFNPNGDKNFVSKTGDAKKVNSPERRAPRISTLTGDGVSLLHNEYAGFNQPFVIPVEVSCPQAGKYTISGNGIETNGSQLVLVDKLLKKETNLTTDFTYQFNADKKEAFTNRFQIVNRTNVRTINENTPNAQLRVSNLANQLTVDVFTDELEAGKLSVTSISGQVVYELNGVMPTQSQTITNQGWAPGIYVVKFEGEKNSLVKKVVIQ
ncbi:MAG: T9SS type A sorting domain-containing protein, partial [Bacteroidia bacterium]|nr:T9SS type A sorting domain-containing protein [Bacteroidia bacterium]